MTFTVAAALAKTVQVLPVGRSSNGRCHHQIGIAQRTSHFSADGADTMPPPTGPASSGWRSSVSRRKAGEARERTGWTTGAGVGPAPSTPRRQVQRVSLRFCPFRPHGAEQETGEATRYVAYAQPHGTASVSRASLVAATTLLPPRLIHGGMPMVIPRVNREDRFAWNTSINAGRSVQQRHDRTGETERIEKRVNEMMDPANLKVEFLEPRQ